MARVVIPDSGWGRPRLGQAQPKHLPSRPDGFGGMLSFELRDAQRVDAMLAAFRLVLPAFSLGGVESLVCIPSRTSHRKMSRGQRERAGISDGLVRVSVGVEDFEDLLEDFTQALGGAGPR
ncbi:MAG: PLP-dependent transferase [Limisphaerales bacterium]